MNTISGGIQDAGRSLDWAMQDFQVESHINTALSLDAISATIKKIDTEIVAQQVQKPLVPITPTLPSPTSTNLPPEPEILFGRDDLVAEITDRFIANVAARLALMGAGGMGKTTLAQAVCRQARISEAFGKRIFWVSCEVANSYETFLELIARAVGAEKPSANRLEDITVTLANAQLKTMIVLDNLETALNLESHQTHVENVLCALFAIQNLAVLVTLRGTLPAPHRLKWTRPVLPDLDPLPSDAARQLWLQIHPEASADPSLDTLLETIGGMPLAVTLLAKRSSESFEPASELIRLWKDERIDFIEGQDHQSSVSISIKLSLDSPRIKASPHATVLLRVFAELPAGIHWDSLKELVPSIEDPSAVCLDLIRSSLVFRGSSNSATIRILPPIARYTRKNYSLESQVEDGIREFYFRYLELHHPYPGRPTFVTVKAAISQEEMNMETVFLKILTRVPQDAAMKKVVEAARLLSDYQCSTIPRLVLINAVVAVVRQNPSDPGALADSLGKQGEMYRVMNMYEDARKCHQEAREVWLRIGDDNSRHGAALELQRLGNVAYMVLDYDEAIKHHEEARSELLALQNVCWAAQSLRSLGDIDLLQSKYGDARIKFERARNEFISEKWMTQAAICDRSIGDADRLLDEYPEAKKKLVDLREEFIRVGDTLNAARCVQGLGDIDRTLNAWTDARTKLHQAREEFLHLNNTRCAAECLLSLGDVDALLGDPDAARKKIQDARDVLERARDRLGVAHCVQSLGMVDFLQSDCTRAQANLEEAWKSFLQIGELRGAAQCQRSIGDIHIVLGQYNDATSKIQGAREEFVRIGASLDAARCLRSLGVVDVSRKDYVAARGSLERARSEFVRIGERRGAAQTVRMLGHIDRCVQEGAEGEKKVRSAREEFLALGDSKSAAECSQDLTNGEGIMLSPITTWQFTEPNQVNRRQF